MTQEELVARIAELERENEELRANVIRRKSFRPVCPESIGEKYGGNKLRAGHFYTSLSLMKNTELSGISKLIRAVCFPKENQLRKRQRGTGKITTHCAIRVDDMTEEQYERYCKILGEVLEILYKYKKEDAA